jgi:hypothetical protein
MKKGVQVSRGTMLGLRWPQDRLAKAACRHPD